MKRYLNVLVFVLTLSLGCVCWACSKDDVTTNEDPENDMSVGPVAAGNRDFSSLRKASNGTISISYTSSDFSLYQKDKYTDNEWTEINLYEIDGWERVSPRTINIKDGRSWTSYKMFSASSGPNELYMPWLAYCKVTGETKSLYVATPIQLDEEAYTISMNGKTFYVLEASEDSFKLSYKSTYSYSDGEVGNQLEVSTYQKGVLDDIDESNILWYDSERALITDICAKIKNKFGNQFNLNDYLAPDIILDDPMVDMDKVEAALLSRLDK
jgi:hypothetical protein